MSTLILLNPAILLGVVGIGTTSVDEATNCAGCGGRLARRAGVGDGHPGGVGGEKGMLFLAWALSPESGGGGHEAKAGTGLLPPACLVTLAHTTPCLRETYPSHMTKRH
jgi:hypothetical protein